MSEQRRFAAFPVALGLAAAMVALGLPPAAAQVPPDPPRPTRTPPEARQPFMPGELLVRFRPTASPVERAATRARHGLERIEHLPLPGLELVRTRRGPIPDVAAEVARDASVRYAEPNHLWYPAQVPPPNDPEFEHLWGLHNEGQTDGTPGADVDALAGWELAADTEEIVVAVIDTGAWTDHPDLQEAIWLNRGELPHPEGPCDDASADDPHDCNGDGVFNVLDYEDDSRIPGSGVPTPDQVRLAFQDGTDTDANGFADDILGWDFDNDDNTVFDPLDGDDHGTHVAGTIAATIDNGLGIVGVSRARIMPLKFLGPQGGSTADAIKAIDYALEMEAEVTNNSWGGGGENQSLKEKIEDANQAGQLFVAAAGNSGVNTDSQPHYPSSYDSANIISVAATSHTDGLASFSNYGATSVDLGAPGASILSTVPRFSKAVLRPRTASTGAVAYHTFGLEGMATDAERQSLLATALSWMGVQETDPIRVVADDGEADFRERYTQALTTLGYTNHDVSSVSGCANGPTQSVLDASRAVIWFTGATFQCTLTSTDQNRLRDYVNGQSGSSPRNLLLFGQDIGYDLTNDGKQVSTFLRETLRAEYLIDFDLNFRLFPVPGSPYEGLLEFELDGRHPGSTPPGGQLFSSGIAARPGGVSGLRIRPAPTLWFSGTSMAAPHVTGVVAHMLAKHPDLGHLHVKAHIMDTGDPIDALAGKTVSGKRLNLAGALTVDGPAAPASLAAAARPAGAIDLSWDASSGPDLDGYRVYRDTSAGVPAIPENLVSGPEPIADASFTDTGTVDGTTYFYVVLAVNTAGVESLPSNEASATADATPPAVTDRSPSPDAAGVGITTQVRATFGEPVDPDTVNAETFTLSASLPVPGEVTYEEATRTATLIPDDPLDHEATYTATVTTAVTDGAGNALEEDVTWSFTTKEAPDTTRPTVAVTDPAPGALLTGSSHTVRGTAADDVAVKRVQMAIRDAQGRYWNGTAFTGTERIWHPAALGDGSAGNVSWSYGWKPLPSADGAGFTIEARSTDTSDNLSHLKSVAVSVDTVAPANPRIRPLGGRFQRDRAFRVSWHATDGSGVASYRVQHRWRHFNGKRSGWSLLGVFQGQGTRFGGRPGRTHCFRVRAVDVAGHASAWSPRRCTTVPLNDGALGRQGPWRRATNRPAHYLDSFSRTRAQGATLRRAGIRRATDAALLFTACPRCGRVEIRWNGERVQRINMRAVQRRPLRVRRLRGVGGKGVLQVVVLSRNRPVIVEGLGIAVRP